MAQVTIYLDKELEARMRTAAKAQNISQSKWIANLIEENLRQSWPASIEEMAGSWQTFPTLEEIRSDLATADVERESL